MLSGKTLNTLKSYIILFHSEPDKLEKQVNANIQEGFYVPQGGLCCQDDYFYQAMILKKDKK